MRTLLILTAVCCAQWTAQADQPFDVVIYAATPSGLASAIVAARQGHSTLLLEPAKTIGGLLTGGLSYTDFKSQESVTGFFREYMDRVLRFYEQKYGPASQQVKDCFRGAHAEPHISLMILQSMVDETRGLRTLCNRNLSRATTAMHRGRKQIQTITVDGPTGSETYTGRMFIDASYEGDLAAAAGAPYRVARESTREYGERFAGVLFFDQGKILPGSTGESDGHAQCANFRPTMTDRADNRLPVECPAGYRRDEYVSILPYFRSGRLREIFTESTEGILRVQRLPNGKADINDIKFAPVRLSLPGENDAWAEGKSADRGKIFERHRVYTLGLLYFLQNDDEIPEAARKKAREWGWPKDEYVDNGHFPTALYVREGRRIQGEYVFTEHDTQPAPQSIRAPLHGDSIAIGDYALNCHGHQPAGPLYPSLVEGDFGFTTTPFQIPYGVIVPQGFDNLLVPVAVSASHVGFSALRLEPTWTAMGHAAGLAAHLALQRNCAVKDVPVARLQEMLHSGKQATIYVPDVPPSSPLFAAVQWAGLQGMLGDVVDYSTARYVGPRRTYGLQYTEAFPNHQIDAESILDPKLKTRWMSRLSREVAGQMPPAKTRGDFLLAAYRLSVLDPRMHERN